MAESNSTNAHASSSLDWVKSLGYPEDELRSVPQGMVCRGCANPTTAAELQAGQTVLDLGCGAGLDAFLAARKVAPTGRVTGIHASADAAATALQHAALK